MAEQTQTCRNCTHWNYCSWLIGSLTGNETECDFEPSKFRPRETVRTSGERGGAAGEKENTSDG